MLGVRLWGIRGRGCKAVTAVNARTGVLRRGRGSRAWGKGGRLQSRIFVNRRSPLDIRVMIARSAHGPSPEGIWGVCTPRWGKVIGSVAIPGFLLTPPHSHVTADANTAALLGDGATKSGALGKAGEFFGTKNSKG